MSTRKREPTDRVWSTRNKELCLGRTGSLALVVGGRHWTDEAWREYCDLYSQMVVHQGPAQAVFNLSPVYGPTSAQRKLLFDEYYRAHGIEHIRRFVLLTESPIVRGIVTALSWFARGDQKTRAEPPARATEALAWVRAEAAFETAEAVEKFAVMIDVVGQGRDLLPQDFWALG